MFYLRIAAVLCVLMVWGNGSAFGQYVFTNWDGDQLWSNPGNWNQPTPPPAGELAWINFTPDAAIIDYAAPNPSEIIVGQGGGDGNVRMTAGGSISTGAINLGWGADRSGSWFQDGGTTNAGELRLGRGPGGINATVDVSGGTLNASRIELSSRTDQGGPAGAASFLNVSDGIVTSSSTIDIGNQGGPATMVVSGGAVTASGAINVANLGAATTATGSLTVNGGSLSALQIGIGPSGGGSGVGSMTIGGDATVSTTNHIFLRPNGSFTVTGSDATINLNRVGATGFEVVNDSVVTFNADAGGFSTVHIPQSTMRFSGPDGILEVDATAASVGTYDLFTFGAGYFNTGFTEFGVENLTLRAGHSGAVLYNDNSIQLQIIPEPTALCLLAIGSVALLWRRRGR